jgi:hypothetical protein
VAHKPRHAGIGDHRRGEHGIGGRQQRTEQERLGPVEVRQQIGRHGHQPRCERHGQHQLAQRQVPGALEHLGLHLEAVAEEDQDQRDHRQRGDEARRRVERQHLQSPLPQCEPGDHEQRCERKEAAPGDAGDQRSSDEQEAQDGQGFVELRSSHRR